MKLRTKIYLSFFLIILVPIVLMTLLVSGIAVFQAARFRQTYGIDVQNLPPEVTSALTDLIAAIIMALIITAVFLSVWIYSGVRTPLIHLAAATKNIKEGNLDFEVRPEGVDEIRELCEDFEEMRMKLKEANEEKFAADAQNRELITNISHDLKTPITTVKGYVEGIMDGIADTPEKMDRYMKTIYAKANEMDYLINELTLYAKIDTNQMPYDFKRVHAGEFFDDAAAELKNELTPQGITFRYANSLAEETLFIVDAEQIQRVINNIVGNAQKHLDKEEKEISLTVFDAYHAVEAVIRDNGSGIAEKDLPYIFDRFYRADDARNTKAGGSGIGLSIVKKIVEEHGGRVWAESTEGEGTAIHFLLRKPGEKRTDNPAEAGERKKRRRGQ